MGTNYFTKEKECTHCGRYGEIHIGKSSMGWKFSFQYNGGQYYKNVKEMKEFLKDKKITNEYGEDVSNQDFWDMVEQKQSGKGCSGGIDFDIDGYTFLDCEFS